jgi:hypothetical protein
MALSEKDLAVRDKAMAAIADFLDRTVPKRSAAA